MTALAFAVACMGSGLAFGRRASTWEGERIGWAIGAVGVLILIAVAARH